MIGKLASKTAESFIKRPSACYDKIEIYQYGFFVLYSNIIFLLLSMLFGAVFGVFLQSIIFFVAFFSIRQYAGGYHASTETRCEIMSTLSILACIVVIKLSKTFAFQTVMLIVSALSAVCIITLCPLDTPEKPLSTEEYKRFRKISLIILSIIVLAMAISYAFKFKLTLISLCMSLVFESILLVAGKIKKRINKEDTIEAR